MKIQPLRLILGAGLCACLQLTSGCTASNAPVASTSEPTEESSGEETQADPTLTPEGTENTDGSKTINCPGGGAVVVPEGGDYTNACVR